MLRCSVLRRRFPQRFDDERQESRPQAFIAERNRHGIKYGSKIRKIQCFKSFVIGRSTGHSSRTGLVNLPI